MIQFSDANETGRFATFTVADEDEFHGTDQLTDESETVYSIEINGPTSRVAFQRLRALECKRIFEGAPRANSAETFDAVCQTQGELVKISLDVYDGTAPGETIEVTGIVTNLRWNASRSAKNQGASFIFYRCDQLRVYVSGQEDAVLSVPGAGGEGE